ncbi:hypothetical protein COV93_06690 [Candidatus Woesearchaeota archaeon CG11_big_fil_rev_8_21_14_0_20_43_8]|nr:MAG: hypothetical protein COV93_06690 [Candidatus Woesearchaeota archaeon CG11_big_fil_rev_8_21_14_0_20_43_8]PIO09016.1 MAG: hypothetical protein COT47_00245 [Candidatus Woesearchaeota archaeon CG08_land_8_20_14_0_20_43_7]
MAKSKRKVKSKANQRKSSKTKQEKSSHPKSDDKPTKRFSNMRKFVIFCVFVAVIFLIFFLGNGKQGQTPATNLVPSGEITAGDTVSVKYVGRLMNGSIFDTNDEVAAKNAGFEIQHTDPFVFEIGSDMVVPGFEDAVLSLKNGERKKFVIKASDAYGMPDPTLIMDVPRTQEFSRFQTLNRTQNIPTDFFKELFTVEPEIGKVVSIESMPWEYEVVAVKADEVSIKSKPVQGQIVEVQGSAWNATVTAIDDKTVTLRADPVDGTTLATPFGDAKLSITSDMITITTNPVIGDVVTTMYWSGVVNAMNSTSITIDLNHPLAGKDLEFEIEVTDIEKADSAATTETLVAGATETTKTNKPKVLMFVMSFCPYGQQMMAVMKPVFELFGDKVDIEPHFVIYGSASYKGKESSYCMGDLCSMHGLYELEEDIRQACIWNDDHKAYWDYSECISQKCSKANLDSCWKSCADDFDIDTAEVEKCQKDEGKTMMGLEKMLNSQYGVQGSPTVFINGETFKGQRTPEDMKKAICSTFADVPSECSQTLGTGATTAAGDCG